MRTLIYQLYPIAWHDGFRGMTGHLPRLADLGVDYVWLSPFYQSPRFDHGYDVADYYKVDRRIGTEDDLARFIKTAHDLGLKVLFDLPINHTATAHDWFRAHPEYYCLLNFPNDWTTLFDKSTSAWEPHPHLPGYHYLHLFRKTQADLRWYDTDGRLNEALVEEFRDLIAHYVLNYGVDGFRIDYPQGMNKPWGKPWNTAELSLDHFAPHQGAAGVLEALFSDRPGLFLMAEVFDPTFGEIIAELTEFTPVTHAINPLLKAEIDKGPAEFFKNLAKSINVPGFVLDLESHDAPRFTSRTGWEPRRVITTLFKSGAENICLYQGQEIGLRNPSVAHLSDERLLSLDAEAKMKFAAGTPVSELRATSRANARVPLPLAKYEKQLKNPASIYYFTKNWISVWKRED